MVLTTFEIIYDKPDKIYSPGDTVSGHVILDVDSLKKMHGLHIKYKGRTKTQWSKGSGKNRRTYNGLEKYFEISKYLVQPTTENNETVALQPGKHTFDFSFILPQELPSSFNSKTGNVKYAVKVTIERTWKLNQTEKKEFFVISHIDLNKIQIIKEPATLMMERDFISCVKSGTIKARILFPCSGYICGQSVPFLIEVYNSCSNVSVQYLNYKLKKHTIVYTTNKKRNDVTKEELLTQSIHFHVRKGERSSHFDTFTVPTIPLYNLEKCNIIDIDYKLKFSLTVSGLHPNIEGKIPVKIGHIPLQHVIPMEQLRFNISLN